MTKLNLSASSLAALCFLLLPATAHSQDIVPEAVDDDGQLPANTIVVVAERVRGQVQTDAPPIAELDEADIEALGAGSIEEVIERIESQTRSGSGRGGRPVFLVNGRRISSFRELRSYPPEALQKVEILPEQVALQFGFSADRRVVNFILKDNFNSKELELEYEQPTAGGFRRTEMEGTYLRIDGRDRLNINAELNDTTPLFESERGIGVSLPVLAGDPDPSRYRTLIGDSAGLELTANWSRGLGESGAGGSFSLNGTFEREDNRSLDGLNTVLLVDGDGNEAFRSFGRAYPLTTVGRTDTYSLGSSLDLPLSGWQVTGTLDAIATDGSTDSDLAAPTEALRQAALADLIAIDGPLPTYNGPDIERASTSTYTLDSLVTASGTPLNLAGLDVSLTLDAGYKWNRIESSSTLDVSNDVALSRSRFEAGFNLGVPLGRGSRGLLKGIGELSVNLGAGLDYLSDFGTLSEIESGMTWSPAERLTLSLNYTLRDTAPSLTQLGAATILRPNVPVFDFVTGETVLADITTGGNPNLQAERQRDWKVSASYRFDLFDDARLNFDYIDEGSDDVSVGFPTLTPAIEAAFPNRVTRAADGTLVAIDQRPVTFTERNASRLRTSFNVSGDIGRYQEPPEGEERQRGPQLGGERPGGQGRWRVSLDHTYEIASEILVSPGGPRLDLLEGDAIGNTGGVSRHSVSANAFAFHKGYGAILSFDYRSPTRINGNAVTDSPDLLFGSLATVDLRAFFDLERLFEDTEALDGTRLSLNIDNVFDKRQRVRDETGVTPLRYQPFFIDPTGRYVGVELRKLF
ncbi:TonB-dependent receptor [Altererythrobacter aurantiacus]|uniref:TonB-dependent receptor n=1 Tax=Parapontixanthobacter aurantiacus TaxID=1463599 RepID=A0A844ZBE2_9SPHN|nr:TonB-dependent receptor [Parapontixanthobacter aurantiacus]MXO84824.1 TonB-dependent receptor [Parapontixanthobacter aurantiacus]